MPRPTARRLTTLLAALLVQQSFAVDVGDPAPKLRISQWIKGDPVSLQDGREKNVYVVQFWSTWCPACRRSLPMLSSLQDELEKKGVVVIGITDEQDDVEAVRQFVKKNDERVRFRVAVDSKRETRAAFFDEEDSDSLNYSFIIDRDGKVAWHGSTRRGMARVLGRVLAGEQAARARARYSGRHFSRMYLRLVSKDRSPEKAKQIGEKAYECMKDDAQGLNLLAWQILTDQQITNRDFAFALRLASRADELTDHEDAAILDTLALAQFENGQTDLAIETQKRAISICENSHWKKEFESRLRRFEEARK